jgi:hypothetical protein
VVADFEAEDCMGVDLGLAKWDAENLEVVDLEAEDSAEED